MGTGRKNVNPLIFINKQPTRTNKLLRGNTKHVSGTDSPLISSAVNLN